MFRDDLLRDRAILITGGGSGLGRAMAERCAELGAAVAILGRRRAPLEETTAVIREAGGTAAWTSCDVRDADALAAAVDRLEEELGPLDGLVNNAAGNFLSPSEDLSANAFDAVLRIVLYGTFYATQILGRRWIERGTEGVVLSIVTPYAWTGSAFVLPSACAKAGVLALTRSLAIEWATYGIRLNAIAPGPFPTEGAFSRLMPEGMTEELERSHPLGRFGRAEELADLACFLLAPGAGYVTGECVTIDGGQWLRHGQEFGRFTDLPREQVKTTMAAMRPGRKGG